MEPDLEVVHVRVDESFTAWSHGYPYRTVRWHFHPEYEIHLVTATSGRMFVGDYIGTFAPGNLVMLGPNLPHNWVSELADGQSVKQRCLVVQFPGEALFNAIDVFPELKSVKSILTESRSGLLFSPSTALAAQPLMRELTEARGFRRIQLFLGLLEVMTLDVGRTRLASYDYASDPLDFMSSKINLAVTHISNNLSTELHEPDLAALTGQSVSAFSRAFRKHTGMTFVSYVNHLRIKASCELLTKGQMSITDICFNVGFNNLSNFNRQFLMQKGMSPSAFRACDEIKLSKCNAV
ncbi:AraC family transcriptional regulator [Glaciimonas immobilis]|uniref:AraC-like DNA-binding protein n=1 Tax=Glaciimonas immobilis TaxID=728004 RepID=A0A840RYV4_9BURK|nr:AraC family transcriptional regulator [Glaciimonas immobilis]MBB5202308.1 AraC-like DNA-binding protein [Glaciimonas immobilis]